jgi:Membrane transporters of cations and cationic drugs
MKKAWLFILLGGLCETGWALALKESDGMSEIPYVMIFAILLAVSMIFLYKALDEGLPMGTAYAVWVGIGAVGTVILGILLMNDPSSVYTILFVSMIIAGIIGLQVTTKEKND